MKYSVKRIAVMLSVIMLVLSCAVPVFAGCDHTYGAGVITGATCTTKGYTTYTCTKCGNKVQNNYTDKLGHAYPDTWEIVSEPSCTETGLQKRVCVRCGGVETQTLSKLAHPDEDGDYICDECGAELGEKPVTTISPYEWFKLLFQRLRAWWQAIFA